MTGRKAASNPKLKEKRQRAWLRAQKRNEKNRLENELRAEKNKQILKDEGIKPRLMTDGKYLNVKGEPNHNKLQSPSRAIRSAFRSHTK